MSEGADWLGWLTQMSWATERLLFWFLRKNLPLKIFLCLSLSFCLDAYLRSELIKKKKDFSKCPKTKEFYSTLQTEKKPSPGIKQESRVCLCPQMSSLNILTVYVPASSSYEDTVCPNQKSLWELSYVIINLLHFPWVESAWWFSFVYL